MSEDINHPELTDEQFDALDDARSRWHTFTATVRIKAWDEADARRIFVNNQPYSDPPGAGEGFWGPLVTLGELVEVAPK